MTLFIVNTAVRNYKSTHVFLIEPILLKNKNKYLTKHSSVIKFKARFLNFVLGGLD